MALLKRQQVHTVYALITADNRKSLRFHEKLGFTPAGVLKKCGFKLGCWHDVAWLEKALIDHAGSPSPLIPFAQLKQAEIEAVITQKGAGKNEHDR